MRVEGQGFRVDRHGGGGARTELCYPRKQKGRLLRTQARFILHYPLSTQH